MVYLCLFGTGKLLLHQPVQGFILLTLSALSAVALYRSFVAGFNQEPERDCETYHSKVRASMTVHAAHTWKLKCELRSELSTGFQKNYAGLSDQDVAF